MPSPQQGAAMRQLGMLRTDELPMIAAHWLVHTDSPSLRRLAGEEGSDGWVIEQLWNDTLAELGLSPVNVQRAWDLAMTHVLDAWHAGQRSTRDVMKVVIDVYIENDYPGWAPEAGHLYGLDDELHGGWGGSREEVLAQVEKTLSELEQRIGERR